MGPDPLTTFLVLVVSGSFCALACILALGCAMLVHVTARVTLT